MNRPELIASLITDKFSGFKEGDESILEAASDARLGEFRAAADTAKLAVSEKERLNTDLTNVKARLKVAEDRIKASETQLSREDFIARAPEDIKALLASHKAQQDAEKGGLVSALKTCGVYSEEELNKKDIPELKALAKFARIHVIDYSSKGLPVERNAEESTHSYAPPDPYAAGIKALQTAGK